MCLFIYLPAWGHFIPISPHHWWLEVIITLWSKFRLYEVSTKLTSSLCMNHEVNMKQSSYYASSLDNKFWYQKCHLVFASIRLGRSLSWIATMEPGCWQGSAKALADCKALNPKLIVIKSWGEPANLFWKWIATVANCSVIEWAEISEETLRRYTMKFDRKKDDLHILICVLNCLSKAFVGYFPIYFLVLS